MARDVQSAVKTDLRLLLECLKFQMKCPDSQKQTLLTIVSICQQNALQNVEFFNEIGGVTFIYNLSKANKYSEVKETALFTLASLAEFNESCKQTLCREETFCDLAKCMKGEVTHRQQRVAVYMICVLVSNNRRGQSFAKASGCIDILLQLFRDSFPVSGGPNELLLLWTSVSSALCGCVNNPQNDENQCVCMCMFPLVKTWLLQVSVSKAEMAQPICSFIGMTVANNTSAQEYFTSVGGLITLTDVLASVTPQCKDSTAACKLAAMITKTLSACIADNETLAPVLSELRVVPDLLLLLSSPNLRPRDRLAVILTLGHCTDACVEHQSQLLVGGGLPLMISLLTDAKDEEVRKAAIFVLQTCKKITESLGGGILDRNEECDLQRHWQSAREILQRIQHLEKRQQKGEEQLVKENSPDQLTQSALLRPEECRGELWEGSVMRKVKGRSCVYEEESDRENILHTYMTPTQPQDQPLTSHRLQNQEPTWNVRRQIFRDFDKSVYPSQIHEEPQKLRKLEMRREENMKKRNVEKEKRDEIEETVKMKAHHRSGDTHHWSNGKSERATCSKLPAEGDRSTQSPDIFRHPAPMKQLQQRKAHSEDELSLCSELLESEIERILITPVVPKPSRLRCAGCVTGVDEVDSRSMGAVLRSCKCQCEFHMVMQQAEDRFKRGLLNKCSVHKHGLDNTCSTNINNMERKGQVGNRPNNLDTLRFINLTPLKRPCETEDSHIEKENISSLRETVSFNSKYSSSGRQNRRNYSTDELVFLNEGVRRFGNSWNSILWSYPFQHGRTNVDLAKKYRKLKQDLAQASDPPTLDTAKQRVY